MNEQPSQHSTLATNDHGISAEAISRRAYEIWLQEGQPEGRDLHHWLRAEQELRAASPATSSTSNSPASSAPVASRPEPSSTPAKSPTPAKRGGSTPPFARAKTVPSRNASFPTSTPPRSSGK